MEDDSAAEPFRMHNMDQGLMAADSIVCLKSSKSGRCLDGDVVNRFKLQFRMELQLNERDHYGATFCEDLLHYVKKEYKPHHQFVWVMSMANDFFDKKNQFTGMDERAILYAGQSYKELLGDRPHVVIFGGKASLWGLPSEYDNACRNSVGVLNQLGLNAVWGGMFMEMLDPLFFTNWHWAGMHREEGRKWLVDTLRTCQMDRLPVSDVLVGPPPPPPPPVGPPPSPHSSSMVQNLQ